MSGTFDDVAGDVIGGAMSANRSILIKVRNVPELVRKQGGALGGLAAGLVPETINATVYDKMAAELLKGLTEKGVDADVKVVEPTGFQAAGGSPIWKPLAMGLGGAGLLMLGWKIVGLFGKKKA